MKPFLAQGACLASRFLGDYTWIAPHYERMALIAGYRERHLWDVARGLALWHDAMESSADNNVAFPQAVPGEPAPVDRVAGADLNTFVYREYVAMAGIASALGYRADATRYAKHAEAVRTAINTHLWSETDASYYNLDVVSGLLLRLSR